MKIRNFLAIAIAIWVGVGFSASVRANSDLQLPKSTTVIRSDIDGNNIPDRIVASYFSRPVLVLDDSKKNTCKTVPGKFVRYTLYPDNKRLGKVIVYSSFPQSLFNYQ